MDQHASNAEVFFMRLAQRANAVTRFLDDALTTMPRDNELERPARLMDAMRHGALNGGKRLRPFLVLETAALFGAPDDEAMRIAAALECIHCYSLVHDDLPAMDDDDMRRGQPTVHRAFDEATAILAGDALLTLAFDLAASGTAPSRTAAHLAIVCEMARAAGCGGMAGGQMLDLSAPSDRPGEEEVIRLQAMKTGALIRFACRAGALLAQAPAADLERMTAYGEALGLAFQIADDLLDVHGDAAELGKATGKDAGAGKATLVALHGADWARRQLDGLLEQAHALLEPYGEDALMLREAARFVANRTS